jgi:rRNA-processing protein EBP2
MSIVSDSKIDIEGKININDDIQREVQFYNITLENVQLALKQLEIEKIPLKRPDDYFAEMYKSDKVMA